MRALKKIIDLQALRHNLQQLTGLAAGAEIIAVVKADAYGHGVGNLLPALTQVKQLAVACMDEALYLRHLGAQQPILLLEGIFHREAIELCAEQNFIPCIHQSEQLHRLRGSSGIRAWLKVDSGMHRLGFDINRRDWLSAAQALPEVHWLGILSHFACADAVDLTDAETRLRALQALKIPAGWQRCLANSAALFALPDARADAVRPGLALYGMSPFSHRSAADLGLKPVMSLQTEVLALHRLSQGEYAGYGHGFRAGSSGNLATIALGYGDGFPRAVESGKLHFALNGKTYPLVGKVAMDMSLLWLGEDEAQVGDKVLIFGEENPIETLALQAGTIPYTLTTMLTSRVHAEVLDG